MDLSGKNVVFIGALGGIGLETSKELMSKNLAYLILLDILEKPDAVKELQAINSDTKVIYIKFDITNKEDIKHGIEEAVKHVEYIDVLINGAGVISDRDVEFTMKVNLIGLIYTTFEALPYMDKTQKGHGGIVANVASVLGLQPSPPIAVYSASKFGVIGFTRSLADQFYYDITGVAFMAICPGLTTTNMTHSLVGKDTFDISKPLSDLFVNAVMQSAEICAKHFVKAIEINQNGAMWMIAYEELKLVEPKVFWEIKYKD